MGIHVLPRDENGKLKDSVGLWLPRDLVGYPRRINKDGLRTYLYIVTSYVWSYLRISFESVALEYNERSTEGDGLSAYYLLLLLQGHNFRLKLTTEVSELKARPY